MEIKHNNMKIVPLWILAVLVNIKSIFTDFGADQAYAVATSYRHIVGDSMFAQMCEPHQTSGFLTDFLMILYKCIVPDLTGVVLFLQFCWVVLSIVVAYCLYKELIHWINSELSQYICIFFLIFRPKQSVFPEFSNMQILFGVLCFVYILRFFRSTKKSINLIWAALFLSLQILSYPTCLVNYLGIVGVLFLFSEQRWRSIGIFTGACVVYGSIYMAIILSQTSLESLLGSINFIINADKSHTGNEFDLVSYLAGFGYGMVWIGASFVLAYVLYRIINKRMHFSAILGAILLFTEVVIVFVSAYTSLDWFCQYFIILPVMIIWGLKDYKYLEKGLKKVYLLGVVMACGSFIAVRCLTNLELLPTISFLMMAGMVSLIPIYERRKDDKININRGLILCILLMILFHRGIVICGYAREGGDELIHQMENIIRVGPAKGIAASLSKCNEIKYGMEDWKTNIQDDTVLVVVPWMLDAIVYVNTEAEVATYSTIDTPTYDESLLSYWEMYPDKIPTVIAVQAWDNQITVAEDTWIMQWVNENYTQYTEGYYWRFYRKMK